MPLLYWLPVCFRCCKRNPSFISINNIWINSPLLLSAAVNRLILCLSSSIQGIILHKLFHPWRALSHNNISNCSARDVCKMSINFIWIHGTCDAFTNRLNKLTHNKVSPIASFFIVIILFALIICLTPMTHRLFKRYIPYITVIYQ